MFPGTLAASLGGNVATNAGGMRAVKYGVTRHQVLGLEAVIGTGEVIRCGGRFVKNTSGYDLTQLIIGSEGTLALVTEATLKLHPRLTHTASILAPFATVDEVAEVVPRIVASGVQPMILEYIDRGTMKGLLRMNDLTLGVPAEVAERTEAYLVVVLEGRDADRLDIDVADRGRAARRRRRPRRLRAAVGPGRRSAGRPRERLLDGEGRRRRRRDRHGRPPEPHPGVPPQRAAPGPHPRLQGLRLRPRR